MKIQATDLHRMAYNAIQFSDKDSAAGGVTLWATGQGFVECWATDDYVALRDQTDCGTEQQDQWLWGLELKDLKALEKELRDRDGEISFELKGEEGSGDGILFFSSLSDFPTVDAVELLTPAVKIIEQSTATHDISLMGPFAIRQNRFAKFKLLRTPGDTEYPVDFAHGMNPQGVGVLIWKLGPHLRGVVGQVDREYLAEYFSEEREVLW